MGTGVGLGLEGEEELGEALGAVEEGLLLLGLQEEGEEEEGSGEGSGVGDIEGLGVGDRVGLFVAFVVHTAMSVDVYVGLIA